MVLSTTLEAEDFTMRVNSYTILHYGKDYLTYSLSSVRQVVQNSYVFYTPTPTHGHTSDLAPPETRKEILDSIYVHHGEGIFTLPEKCVWAETAFNFNHEGQQRDYCLAKAAMGADLVLVLDYDEVWPESVLRAALDYVWQENKARNWLINFTHLWRGFDWCCRDDAWPVRIIDTRHNEGTAYIPRELGEIYHFGYAISDELMRYKLSIHGHKGEIRPEWYEMKWLVSPPVEDCHPANGRKTDGTGYWNTEPFDRNSLPEIMRNHPLWK